MDFIRLNDNVRIPVIGFGVFMIPNDGSTYRAVLEALKPDIAISTGLPHISMRKK